MNGRSKCRTLGGLGEVKSPFVGGSKASTAASELSSAESMGGNTSSFASLDIDRAAVDGGRNAFGCGDGLSSARIMRLAMADDGSRPSQGEINSDSIHGLTVLPQDLLTMCVFPKYFSW